MLGLDVPRWAAAIGRTAAGGKAGIVHLVGIGPGLVNGISGDQEAGRTRIQGRIGGNRHQGIEVHRGEVGDQCVLAIADAHIAARDAHPGRSVEHQPVGREGRAALLLDPDIPGGLVQLPLGLVGDLVSVEREGGVPKEASLLRGAPGGQ